MFNFQCTTINIQLRGFHWGIEKKKDIPGAEM